MRPPVEPDYRDNRRRVTPLMLERPERLSRRLDRPPALEPGEGCESDDLPGGLTSSSRRRSYLYAQIMSGPYTVPNPHTSTPELPQFVGYSFRQVSRLFADPGEAQGLFVSLDGVSFPNPPNALYPWPTPDLAGVAIELSGNQYVPIGVCPVLFLSDNGRNWEFQWGVPGGPLGPILPPTGPPDPLVLFPPVGTVTTDTLGTIWVTQSPLLAYGTTPTLTSDHSALTVTVNNSLTENFGGSYSYTVNANSVSFGIYHSTTLYPGLVIEDGTTGANISLFATPGATNYQTGVGVFFIKQATTAPTSPPSGGSYLYSDVSTGHLTVYNPGGTPTDLTAGTPPGIFVVTATTTVTGTTSQTTLVGSGVGSLSLAANYLAAGSVLRVRAGGPLAVGAGQSATVRFKLDANAAGHAVLTNAFANISGRWSLDVIVTVRTAGGGGTTYCAAEGRTDSASLTDATGTDTPGVDTTTTITLDLTAQLSLAGDSIGCDTLVVEKVR